MRRILIASACLTLVGCADESFARFEVEGIAAYDACLNTVFPFEPDFLAVRQRPDSAGLLMQTPPGGLTDADIVYLEIFDIDAAKAGTPITFALPGTLDAAAIGELQLASCPDVIDNIYISGEVVFSSFGTEWDDLVVGELRNARLDSARQETTIASSFTGNWQIKVQEGQPYEEFYGD